MVQCDPLPKTSWIQSLEPITPEVIRKVLTGESHEPIAPAESAPTAILHAEMSTIDGNSYLCIFFRNETRLLVPIRRIKEITEMKSVDLGHLEISLAHDAISFPEIDADIYVPGLLSDLYGTKILKSGKSL